MARGKTPKKESLSIEERLEQALVPDWGQPYKVPSNWVWTRGFALFLQAESKKPSGKDFLYIDIESIDNKTQKISEPKKLEVSTAPSRANRGLKVGDTLFSLVRPYLKNIAYVEEIYQTAIASTGFFVCRPNNINTRFLYWLMCSGYVVDGLNKFMKGDNSPSIRKDDIERFEFPLPPLAEQQRIVDRIESLFAKLDEAKEKTQAALDSFENRKAAILHQAFTGELTNKWREENGKRENNYLQNIKEYLDKLNRKDRIRVEEQIEKIVPHEICGWLKCSVGAIGVVSNGSTPSRKVKDYWNGSIHWVSSGEVKNNIISSTRESITEEGFNNSSVNYLPKGTVLIAMIGEGKTRGQSAILDIEATINQNIAAIVANTDYVLPKFLWYCFQKNYTSNRERGSGSGPKALNCQRVRELDFILPPLPEQTEIVRILDNLFEKEQKAKELADVIEKIDLMKKVILARAFRGELGTNDPYEESAKALLKEILEAQNIEPRPKKASQK